MGGHRVLDSITCEFPAGQTTAVLGPSGSGKSTLLRHINGLRPAEAGELYVGQIDVVALQRSGAITGRLDVLRRQIGYAVQGSALFPHLNAGENIAILARELGWAQERVDARIAELLDLMRLPLHYRDRFPHELSGGEQQRVGLCRAMFARPKILLLDEAFGALDPLTRADIHASLREMLRAEPLTVVLVTHDPAEARELAAHWVVLEAGRVLQQGSPAELRANPAGDFIRRICAIPGSGAGEPA